MRSLIINSSGDVNYDTARRHTLRIAINAFNAGRLIRANCRSNVICLRTGSLIELFRVSGDGSLEETGKRFVSAKQAAEYVNH